MQLEKRIYISSIKRKTEAKTKRKTKANAEKESVLSDYGIVRNNEDNAGGGN